MKKIVLLLKKLTKPLAKDENKARREFILNVLLLGINFLAFACFVSAKISYFFVVYQSGQRSDALASGALLTIFLIFLFLYILSRFGWFRLSAYSLVWLCFSLAVYTILHWGVYVPQGLLTFVLVIIMSGVLIGTWLSTVVTLLTAIAISGIFFLQSHSLITYDSSWRTQPIHFTDIFVYVATIAVISSISWLSNREIEKSLEKAQRSEEELRKERDLLEEKVRQRTAELENSHAEQIRQLSRFVEFGRISAGIFHDLLNYLAILFLNMEQAAEIGKTELKEGKKYLKDAFKARRSIENFISAAKKQLSQQEVKADFSPVKEIKDAITILKHKAMKRGVEIEFSAKDKSTLFGNAIKFNQVITNIISNAIDAHEKVYSDLEKKVFVAVSMEKDETLIVVEDNGPGIAPEDLVRLFEPFYTTKISSGGIGIGLSLSKQIIEDEFGGEIFVKSVLGEGAKFSITLPKSKHYAQT